MRKTYAFNSVIFGIPLAILVYAISNNIVLTVLTGLGVTVAGYFIIRVIEKALYKGAEKISEKIHDSVQK